MRRIRTATGELIERVHAVRDHKGKIRDVRECIMLENSDYALKKEVVYIEDCITGEKILSKNSIPVQLINTATGSIEIKNTTASSVSHYNNQIMVYKPWKDMLVDGLDDNGHKFYFYKSDVERLGLGYDWNSGYYTKKAEPKTSYRIDSRKYSTFNNLHRQSSESKRNRFFGTDSPTNIITEGFDTRFGVELETASGYLKLSDYYPLNLECVYDGSLRDPESGEVWGGEYVTGILRGDMGFNQLNLICKELSRKCTVDKLCGMHVHISIVPSNLYIVNLYKLLTDIESEMFSFVPKSRRNGGHSKSLPKLSKKLFEGIVLDTNNPSDRKYMVNSYFADIKARIAVEKVDSVRNARYTKHPLGEKCGYDKSTMRYCWVNFVPALFVRDRKEPKDVDINNDFTIEFRSHSGTTNFIKVKNWVKLCMAITHYASAHSNLIFESKKVSVEEIVLWAYPKSGKALVEYLKERRNLFNDEVSSAKEYTSDGKDTSILKLTELIKNV